ncbi:transposase [Streptomyces sp. NBC_00289]|uniref:transposase n=1 Tax=Streptomyces sp. NBC_00289 TaxID=2975703 RepID=UPI0032498BCF
MVACPDCRCESARVHSRYSRTLADVAGGRPVLISLAVRRLFCDSVDCGRRTFAEQVEGLTVRCQRRSPLLQHLVEMAGVLLAGRGGARLLRILRTPLSRTSVLFQLMRMGLPAVATPRVLVVDDFALYADVYGTLLVNADTRLPIELWAGRDGEQLASWLRAHPGVEVVCRDGSLVYRQGIAQGAPDAVQVSDRFHLWQGLSKRVSDIAAAHRGCLAAAILQPEPAPPPSDEPCEAGRYSRPPSREATVRDRPGVHRHGPQSQCDSPRARLEPPHRGQVRTRCLLAGVRTAHSAPPTHEPRPVSGVSEAAVGGRRAHRDRAAPGDCRQGLRRP